MPAALRTLQQRQADTRALLGTRHADVWVATSSLEGVAHLVPLSFAWDGTVVTLSCLSTTTTARNLQTTRRARLAFGHSRDVVMMDALLTDTVAVFDAPLVVAEGYEEQSDWDPRDVQGGDVQGGDVQGGDVRGDVARDYVYLRLRPERIQAWREVAENLRGRTIMRDGHWLE